MGLAQVQAALARLYTDPAIRDMLEHDPEALRRECHLSDEDLEKLTHLSTAQLEFFAGSLRSKRRGEVAKLLPRTARALGGQYRVLFNKYSAAYLPAGEKKHLEDALNFGSWLQANEVPGKAWISSMAAYESAWLEISSLRKTFIARILKYDVDTVHNDLSNPDISTELAVWINFTFTGVRHWILSRRTFKRKL